MLYLHAITNPTPNKNPKLLQSSKRQRAFTLLELMLVLAIIGILAAAAWPNYQASVARARRADAVAALLGLSSAMERHFTKHNSYCAASAGTDCAGGAPAEFSATAPVGAAVATYNLTIKEVTTIAYTLTATPVGTQTDDACGVFSLTSTGLQGVSGSAAVATCW